MVVGAYNVECFASLQYYARDNVSRRRKRWRDAALCDARAAPTSTTGHLVIHALQRGRADSTKEIQTAGTKNAGNSQRNNGGLAYTDNILRMVHGKHVDEKRGSGN